MSFSAVWFDRVVFAFLVEVVVFVEGSSCCFVTSLPEPNVVTSVLIASFGIEVGCHSV